jgi:hypothetical protein
MENKSYQEADCCASCKFVAVGNVNVLIGVLHDSPYCKKFNHAILPTYICHRFEKQCEHEKISSGFDQCLVCFLTTNEIVERENELLNISIGR